MTFTTSTSKSWMTNEKGMRTSPLYREERDGYGEKLQGTASKDEPCGCCREPAARTRRVAAHGARRVEERETTHAVGYGGTVRCSAEFDLAYRTANRYVSE